MAKLLERKPEIANAIELGVTEALDVLKNRVLPIDLAVAELWGEMLAEGETHIDDAGSAAIARINGLVLLTRNVVRRGLDTLDPYKPSPKMTPAKAKAAS